MRPGLLALALLAAAATCASAAETTVWPPPGPTAERMKELQQVLHDREATALERENARRELAKMLKSAAGQARETPDEKPTRPARAPARRRASRIAATASSASTSKSCV